MPRKKVITKIIDQLLPPNPKILVPNKVNKNKKSSINTITNLPRKIDLEKEKRSLINREYYLKYKSRILEKKRERKKTSLELQSILSRELETFFTNFPKGFLTPGLYKLTLNPHNLLQVKILIKSNRALKLW